MALIILKQQIDRYYYEFSVELGAKCCVLKTRTYTHAPIREYYKHLQNKFGQKIRRKLPIHVKMSKKVSS